MAGGEDGVGVGEHLKQPSHSANLDLCSKTSKQGGWERGRGREKRRKEERRAEERGES